MAVHQATRQSLYFHDFSVNVPSSLSSCFFYMYIYITLFTFFIWKVTCFDESHCRRPVLHFLFLVYDRVHNGDLWEHFFASAPEDSYFINIQHSKVNFYHDSWPSSLSARSEIAHYTSKVFRYARYVYASDNLLNRALNRSIDTCDQFLLLSGDAVPIVNFETMFSRFIAHDRVNKSSLCITDTAQWIRRKNTNEYYVKHHNWWTLNRMNATYATHLFASMSSNGEREEDLFGRKLMD